ncbi:adenosine 5'-monophosphoramidase HINT3-like [Sitodiplosis mosellana]|uniref:adenosine 5'-monophosphoramidase HINT3-like n=1 Tax=Sitodiplosis mosellana TaxID=263140 RepID=UPI002444126B|nr:adenosine 5'-monophosphoramidase HINT3-like [Sitodiplosis mosellana]
MSNTKPCIFCDIVAGKSPDTVIEFSNEHIIIFNDIRPASDYHYLAVPKNHMQNVRECTLDDKDLIIEMQNELRNLLSVKNVNLDDVSYGFHWPPFTSIDHLHMHAIAPVSKMGFVQRLVFKPINMWYCTPEYVLSKLKPATHT